MRDLRTDQEIMRKWKSDTSKPLVSIDCTAYNHEKYIEDALEGFLIQETDFPFEILVHDDASTDKTADIIKEYEARYPNLIKPIYQIENQFSKGNKPGSINRKGPRGNILPFVKEMIIGLIRENYKNRLISLRKTRIIQCAFIAQ